MGFAAVARVTHDRWICLAANDQIAFGLTPGGELKIETTICREVRNCQNAVIIDHVAEDAAFRDHPVPALYGFQSYISMPIFLMEASMARSAPSIPCREKSIKKALSACSSFCRAHCPTARNSPPTGIGRDGATERAGGFGAA